MERIVYKVRANTLLYNANTVYSTLYFELVMFITPCRHCVNLVALFDKFMNITK